jgi:hypothetical protein
MNAVQQINFNLLKNNIEYHHWRKRTFHFNLIWISLIFILFFHSQLFVFRNSNDSEFCIFFLFSMKRTENWRTHAVLLFYVYLFSLFFLYRIFLSEMEMRSLKCKLKKSFSTQNIIKKGREKIVKATENWKLERDENLITFFN